MAFGTNVNSSNVGIASTDYAQRTRQLIKLITELRALGAQAHIDLPRIAVIGNQSAGKSSLVEAISDNGSPSKWDVHTHDRCPMECRLQNSPGQWKCQILLRFERDADGQRVMEVQEHKFGPLITDKSELEDMLRRAQLAILNPSVSYEDFVDFDLSTIVNGQPPAGSTRLLQFSSNVVCLDIYGPDVVDLSFIDLPGIISNVANGEDRNNIGLIKDLVKENIKGNALILLTLTMRDDLENQSAAFLAKEADPEGMRTVGVLTKADAILPGEEDGWLQVLEGEIHQLKHGYYVTKQPGPEDLRLKLTHAEARESERSFFATTEVWRSSSSRVKSRTGIPNLTNELSKLLNKLILKTLPKLRRDASHSRDENSRALAELPPPPPEDPVVELLRLLTDFSDVANKWIEGDERHEELLQCFRSASAEFKMDILRTAPDFRPYESSADEPQGPDSESNFNNRIEDDPDDIFPEGTPMYLTEVQDLVKRSLTRQLPYNVPYSAKRILIEQSFSQWNLYASAFFEKVCHATVDIINTIIKDNFSRFVMSPLHDHVQHIIDHEISRHGKQTTERISWFLELEKPPFTQNDDYFSSLRSKYLGKYKAVRQSPGSLPNFTVSLAISQAISALAQAGFQGLTSQDLQKLSPPDRFEEELMVMAEVSAYARIAYKRVIDDIPRIVDHDFLGGFGRSVQKALITGIGMGTEDATAKAEMYLAEDPDVVERRKSLLANKERLDAVLNKLLTFGMIGS